MLERVVGEHWLRAEGVFGLFAANACGDDIEVYDTSGRLLQRLPQLRQQRRSRTDAAYESLADFVAPKELGLRDYIGAFAVTAGIGLEQHVTAFEAAHDDYSAIMLKALADRLAEAFAERLHERVRKEFWGYAADETLDHEARIAERYRGIRPAPGYPACPDHTAKRAIWDLLDAEREAGMTLTDSYAMLPTASVSGWYFAHPAAHYFAVGKLARDQVSDYAARKSWTIAEAERWLAPLLGYDPSKEAA
jgi:5-methyltetrahydrofolate--homocysteine methyltransferase